MRIFKLESGSIAIMRQGLTKLLARRATVMFGGMFIAALLVAGCATTQVDVLWANPDFVARKIEGKIMVVGLTRDQAMRRVYEDELVAQLAARGPGAGVGTIRSYEVIPGAFDANGTRTIIEAARRQGATAILSSAVVGHEHIAHMTISEPPGYWHGMYEGWYGYYWPYLYQRTEVHVTQRYQASTTLIDVASGKIRWTVRTHTDATGDVNRDIKGFAGVVVDMLARNGLF